VRRLRNRRLRGTFSGSQVVSSTRLGQAPISSDPRNLFPVRYGVLFSCNSSKFFSGFTFNSYMFPFLFLLTAFCVFSAVRLFDLRVWGDVRETVQVAGSCLVFHFLRFFPQPAVYTISPRFWSIATIHLNPADAADILLANSIPRNVANDAP